MLLKKHQSQKILEHTLQHIKENLFDHVVHLSEIIGPRHVSCISSLNQAANYINKIMTQYHLPPQRQTYLVENNPVCNLIVEKTGWKYPEEIFVIGAHYDTVFDSPGADDNASGVAAVLELLRMLRDYANQRTLRFIAFTLEEPPFFDTDLMGSTVYARQCRHNGENIIGMMSLEMLGYYTDAPMSQQYPVKEMTMIYPERGNFIGIVGNRRSESLTRFFSKSLKETNMIKLETLVADLPAPGIDLSDHASFWQQGYPAFMVTDTAFYRFPLYHTAEDRIGHLNFKKFSRLVYGLTIAVKKLDGQND